jgi:Rrf2 family protein
MVSQKTKYALHALMALARAESMVIPNIAVQERIPRKFLEHILLELKRHGLVQSRRGKLGGYALLMPANRITFGQVLRILDGPIALLACLSATAYRRCASTTWSAPGRAACLTPQKCDGAEGERAAEYQRGLAKAESDGTTGGAPQHRAPEMQQARTRVREPTKLPRCCRGRFRA